MGNQSGKLSRHGKNGMNIRESMPVDDTQHDDENSRSERICVTTRSENSTIGSLEGTENGLSTNVSNGSTSDLSISGVQHLIRETANNVSIVDSNGVHIGDNINCYGAVSFVNTTQSNVRITNEQQAAIKHDFESGTESTDVLRIFGRNQWFARQPKDQLDRLESANRIIIAHTGYTHTRMLDVNIVRNIQDYHVQTKRWFDIGYNFMIGRDGSVFVGRGWLYQGAHSRDYNRGSICIAFIGNFNNEIPSDESLIAAQRLIERGVELGRLDKNCRVYGHCQVILTESPGIHLYEAIQTWDRWSHQVELLR